MDLYGFSESDVARLRRLLQAFEGGRLDRAPLTRSTPLPGPQWTKLGKTAEIIPAASGGLPGEGEVAVWFVDAETGEFADADLSFDAMNPTDTAIASGAWVVLTRDPMSGRFWATPAGSTFTATTVDGTPSYAGTATLQFDEADGFVLTNPSAGVTRVDITAATDSFTGVVTTTSQTFGGAKTFKDAATLEGGTLYLADPGGAVTGRLGWNAADGYVNLQAESATTADVTELLAGVRGAVGAVGQVTAYVVSGGVDSKFAVYNAAGVAKVGVWGTSGGGDTVCGGLITSLGFGSPVPDGDKGDITVSISGTVWTIDAGAVDTSKMGGDVTTAGKALLDDATAADQRTTLGLGTVATQAANAIAITGGNIDGTVIGGTTPAAGTFTVVYADTLTVGGSTLRLNDTLDAFYLAVSVTADLTANRTLTITTGDANRTLTLAGNATISGTNTGDQTLYNQTVEDEGTPVTQRSTINFTGAGVSVADTGGKTTVTISGGGVSDGDKGDITVASSGATWTIDTGAVTPAKMSDGAAVSVLGRSVNSSGVRADIAATPGSGPGVLIFDEDDDIVQWKQGTGVLHSDGASVLFAGDPGADRIVFWDESLGTIDYLTVGLGLSITGSTLSASGSGDVVGPASATDNAIARYDGATGKLIQTSGASIADTGAMNVLASEDTAVTARRTTIGVSGTQLLTDAQSLTSGTPLTGFGGVQRVSVETDGAVRAAFDVTTTWATVADGSRKSRTTFGAYDASALRECVRIESDGSVAMVGFLGASAVVRQTGDAGTALVTLGLMSGTPTFAAANLTGTLATAQYADGSVTYVKMQAVASDSRLLGRGTAGGTAVREISLGSGLSMSGDVLSSTGGAGINKGTATLNFGAFPGATDATVAVTGQTGILSDSVVVVQLRPVATADHSADEHVVEEMDVLSSDIVAATGFTIRGKTRNHRLYGQWTVGYMWG